MNEPDKFILSFLDGIIVVVIEWEGNPKKKREYICIHIADSLCYMPSMGSHRVGHDWSDLTATATETNTTL